MTLALRHRPTPDSPLARWDARWKLAALVLAVAGTAALDRVGPAAPALGPGWDAGPVRVSQHGVVAGLAVFLRCLAIGSFALVLVGTAPLHHTLAAAHRLKVPGLLVLVALLAYRYAFLLADELRRLRVAL